MDDKLNRPRKLKRHFFLWPILIAFVLLMLGEYAGVYLILPLRYLFTDKPEWYFLLDYLVFIGIAVVVLVFCALFERPLFRSFFHRSHGGLKGNTVKDFFIGVGIGFLMNAVCITAAWINGDLHFSFGGFMPLYLVAAFICVLVQSGSEELLTRGYIYGAHVERYPVWVAVIGNSLLFGAIHLSNNGITVMSFLEMILSGISFSLVVYALNSLWTAVGIHTMWNYTQNILFGLPNSGIASGDSLLHLDSSSDSILYNTEFGVEGELPCIIVDILLCVWCFYLIYKNKKQRT